MPENFVCVSGVSNLEELEKIGTICAREHINLPVTIGYQISNKSINQGTQNSRQPLFSNLGKLVYETRQRGIIPSIHYYTKNPDTVLGDLEKISERIPLGTLLQFNTLPLDADTLQKSKDMGFEIIFKVAVANKKNPEGGYAVWKGEDVIDVDSENVSPLINQILERKDVIDYAMFDPSHGTNLELDLNGNSSAIIFGRAIVSNQELSHLGLVYAGGIKPNNTERTLKSLQEFIPRERISIDIESGVRINNELDMGLVREYLRAVRYNL